MTESAGRGGRRPGAGRPRKDADGAILAAARRLLRTGGYQQLSVGAVADAAHVSPGTVYRRWPSKTALALAAYGETIGPADPPDTGGLRTDLLALSRETAEFFTGEHGRLLSSLASEAGNEPDVLAAVRASTASRRAGLKAVLVRAVDRGEIPPDTDVELALDLILGPLWTRLLVSGQTIDRALVEETMELVSAALTMRRPTKRQRSRREIES